MAHPKDGRYRIMNDALDAYGLGQLPKGGTSVTGSGKTIDKNIDVWLPIVDGKETGHSNMVCGDYIIEEAEKRPSESFFTKEYETIIRKDGQICGNNNCYYYEYFGKTKIICADEKRLIFIHARERSCRENNEQSK